MIGSSGDVGIRSRVGSRGGANWLIPTRAAEAITAAVVIGRNFDMSALADAAFRAGTPAIPLVKMLTDQVRKTNAEAARFVHWGATSQDVADTAMSLLLKRAEPILSDDLLRLEKALGRLVRDSQGHRHARANSASACSASDLRSQSRRMAGLGSARDDGACRSGFRQARCCNSAEQAEPWLRSATAVRWLKRSMQELGFGFAPAAPWHTQRDQMASLICACGVLTGSLGKMARDISLLMQNEVGEAAEPEATAAAGPRPCRTSAIQLLVRSRSRPRIAYRDWSASFLSAMLQEHERGVGGGRRSGRSLPTSFSQLEWRLPRWLKWPKGSQWTRRRCASTSRTRAERFLPSAP